MRALINAKIYPMTGGVIERGTILIDEGKILDVGAEIAVPAGANLVDCSGKVVIPGIIDAHTHIGIGEEGIGWEGRDYNEMTDPLTPDLRAIDGINPEDQGFQDARAGGITTVMTGPGSANVLGGQNVVIKTYGRTIEGMILRNPAGVKGAFGENPKRVYGQGKSQAPMTRMATAGLMRKILVKAQNYKKKLEKGREDADKMPDRDLQMEILVDVLEKRIPLRLHAHRADDIMTILRIAREFDINVTIEHCTEGHKIAEEIAAAGVPTVVGPSLTNRAKVELNDRTFETPNILYQAGVKIALMTDHPVIPLQYLPVAAALCVKEGLPYEEALKAITINSAEILGVADRVGSLEKGKDADLVVYDGDPLAIQSKIELVLINGEPVYEK
ncbi:MAG: amidohydrolase [Halanaerobium sp.]|nr:amidohydrolase [Halanaerobium sp.]